LPTQTPDKNWPCVKLFRLDQDIMLKVYPLPRAEACSDLPSGTPHASPRIATFLDTTRITTNPIYEEEGACGDSLRIVADDDLSPKKKKPLLSYDPFVWVLFLAITILAIYDRFSWNLWPRQRFSVGRGSAGSDNFGFKEGPWSVRELLNR
jgi:hypothetical protein